MKREYKDKKDTAQKVTTMPMMTMMVKGRDALGSAIYLFFFFSGEGNF
jgi:hypothetical protein